MIVDVLCYGGDMKRAAMFAVNTTTPETVPAR
jgi:hypothetical protein